MAGQDVPGLPGLIAGAAARHADAVAISEPGRSDLTYGCLPGGIDEVTRVLRRLGISRTDRVAIVLPSGAAGAFGFLAVASAAVAAPLNPAYHRDEFEFYLKDLGAALVVVDGDAPGALHDAAGAVGVRLAELTDGHVLRPAGPAGLGGLAGLAGSPVPDEPAQGGSAALVLHTSGTTGRPKIVPLTHANLYASAMTIARSLALTPADRCLNIMPLFHIHGLVAGLLAPLTTGGSSVCVPGFDRDQIIDWLGLGVTWYTGVPTLHQAVLDAFKGAGRPPVGLRFIRSCSSALPPTLMAALEEAFGVPVVEAYGMTEAAHQIAANPLPPAARKPGSAGLASGAEVRVLDSGDRVAPAGVRGEVVIRGAGVTSGYEDDDAKLRAFADGWLRTGDEGYLDPDGYLFLTGRLKELINRGGEKIAPREIEEVLLGHPAVTAVAVFAVPNPVLGEEVGTAIVPRPGHAVDAPAIGRYARERLAHFKVPRYIWFVEEIPKGPTGKVQRIGLAEKLDLDDAVPDTVPRPEFRAPRTRLERSIAELYEQVLGVEHVGLDDDFLALGGDSMQASQAVARIRTQQGVALTLADLLDRGTPAMLAVAVRERSVSAPAMPKLTRVRRDPPAQRDGAG